ncbi:DUF2946 family protein [Kaistia terrae]
MARLRLLARSVRRTKSAGTCSARLGAPPNRVKSEGNDTLGRCRRNRSSSLAWALKRGANAGERSRDGAQYAALPDVLRPLVRANFIQARGSRLNLRLRQGLSAEATLFVALMLVVQILLSGLSLGVQAAILGPDAFSHVLCTADGARSANSQSPDGSPLAHEIDCCTFGCSMVGGAVPAAPDDGGALLNNRGVSQTPVLVSAGPAGLAQRTPQNPRAPPGGI